VEITPSTAERRCARLLRPGSVTSARAVAQAPAHALLATAARQRAAARVASRRVHYDRVLEDRRQTTATVADTDTDSGCDEQLSALTAIIGLDDVAAGRDAACGLA